MDNQLDKRTITTADAYKATPDPIQKQGFKTATIVVRNTGTANPATFKVEGSIDNENWFAVGEATDVAKEASAKVAVTEYWPFLRVNAKSKEAGKSTTVQIAVASCAG